MLMCRDVLMSASGGREAYGGRDGNTTHPLPHVQRDWTTAEGAIYQGSIGGVEGQHGQASRRRVPHLQAHPVAWADGHAERGLSERPLALAQTDDVQVGAQGVVHALAKPARGGRAGGARGHPGGGVLYYELVLYCDDCLTRPCSSTKCSGKLRRFWSGWFHVKARFQSMRHC